MFYANGNEKTAGVAILISAKIGFKAKTVTKDKEGHYIMIKGSVHQEDITIVNIDAPNIGAPKYIKQLLTNLKEEIDSSIIILGKFNNALTSMDRLSTQKTNTETLVSNDRHTHTHIYRILCPRAAEIYILFKYT